MFELMINQQVLPIDEKFGAPRNATFTHFVAQYGTQQMLQVCLERGPDLTLRDEFGYTVMHYACMGGNKACFELLAEQNLDDLDAVSEAGVTCLMAAVKSRDE